MLLSFKSRFLLYKTLVVVAVLSASLLSMAALQGSPWGFVHRGDSTILQDFAVIVNYSKDFWQGHNPHLYTLDGHLGFMLRWTGEVQDQALCFGYSPTMLVLLYPLTWLNPIHAYLLWSILPFVILISLAREERELQLLCLGTLTATGLSAVALGQTAPWAALSALGVLFIMFKTGKKETIPNVLKVGFLVFLATAKPPVALALLFLLLLDKRWKTVGLVLGLVLVEVALFTAWLGTSWIGDYMHLISNYSPDSAPAALATTLHPNTMSNFSLVLHSLFDLTWATTSRISNGLWLISSVAIVGWAWLEKGLLAHVKLATSFCLIWASYLLFVSHLTITEDLLILLPVWLVRNMPLGRWLPVLAVCWLTLNIGVNKPLLSSENGTVLLFTLKCLIVCFCLFEIQKTLLTAKALKTV